MPIGLQGLVQLPVVLTVAARVALWANSGRLMPVTKPAATDQQGGWLSRRFGC